ncbi:MAG: CpsB/CapC family capsule biosynthesis tyrosine phosphatase [Candidatus Cloacimonadales bacterium]
MKVIDIHTHILPNVDDGSDSLEKSLKHLQTMAELGVEKVFLTPHYMMGEYANNLENVKQHFDVLKAEASKLMINIELVLGAEVYCDPTVLKQALKEKLTLGDSNYMLFETSLNDIADNTKEFIYTLQMNRFRPILAHPERYSFVHSYPGIVKEFMRRDVLIQVNASSLLGYHGRKVKEVAWRLLYKGYAHFVASDDHCRHSDYLLKKAYNKVVDKIDEKTAKLLFYDNPLRVYNNEEIMTFYLELRSESSHSKRRPRPWWKKVLSLLAQ